jgi:hypothetical protein
MEIHIDRVRGLNSNDQHLKIAEIFAMAILRLHQRGTPTFAISSHSQQTALEAGNEDLEQSRETLLSITRGLRSESPRQGAIDGRAEY